MAPTNKKKSDIDNDETRKNFIDTVDSKLSSVDKGIKTFDTAMTIGKKLFDRARDGKSAIDEYKRKQQAKLDEKQQVQIAEIAKKEKDRRRTEIQIENLTLSEQSSILQKFHKQCHIWGIEQYLNAIFPLLGEPIIDDYYKKNAVDENSKIKAEYIYNRKKAEEQYKADYKEFMKNRTASKLREDAHNSIINGGEWFGKYLSYNLDFNRNVIFGAAQKKIDVSVDIILLQGKRVKANIKFPFFDSFNLVKHVHYREDTNEKTEEFFEEDVTKEIYIKTIYSILLQTMAVIFGCADPALNLGSDDYLVDKLYIFGDKGFIEASTGKEYVLSVIKAEITKEQYYTRIDPEKAFPEKLFSEYLGTKTHIELFFKDDYDSEVVKKAINGRKHT